MEELIIEVSAALIELSGDSCTIPADVCLPLAVIQHLAGGSWSVCNAKALCRRLDELKFI